MDTLYRVIYFSLPELRYQVVYVSTDLAYIRKLVDELNSEIDLNVMEWFDID